MNAVWQLLSHQDIVGFRPFPNGQCCKPTDTAWAQAVLPLNRNKCQESHLGMAIEVQLTRECC